MKDKIYLRDLMIKNLAKDKETLSKLEAQLSKYESMVPPTGSAEEVLVDAVKEETKCRIVNHLKQMDKNDQRLKTLIKDIWIEGLMVD